MPKTATKSHAVDAEEIAKIADRGGNVMRFFAKKGRMMQPIKRVNVDFTAGMLEELDEVALNLNISRQAVIKTLLRHALDQQHPERRAR